MQRIVGLLVFLSPEALPILQISPWVDRRIPEPIEAVMARIEAQEHRRFLKSHLPACLHIEFPRAALGRGALVCGKIIREKDRKLMREHFETNGWLLWDDAWLKEHSASCRWRMRNSPVAVVSKLLLRG